MATITRDHICAVLLERHALGVRNAHREDLARAVGYQCARSPGFIQALLGLAREGLVAHVNREVFLNPNGLLALPRVERPQTNQEQQERLLAMLRSLSSSPVTMNRIFHALLGGRAFRREELAFTVGFVNERAAGFVSALATMGSLGLIQVPQEGFVQLTNVAFPFGFLVG